MEVRYVTGFLLRKKMLYHAPPFRILLITNQGVLTFKNGSENTMDFWKLNLEVRTLVLVWMDITTSLMMMNILMQRVILMKRNTKN